MSETTAGSWKVDLHVHSEHSDAPYSWFLRSAGAAECYTPADIVYEVARRRGMDLVTLADHDTIDGALELCSRHADAFVSVEISARFPEDGCIVHVIGVDLSERQHRETQALRRDVYELAAYLEQERIGHFWCHPLSQVNGRLTRRHLEAGLLMFRAVELRNGTRDPAHERGLLEVLGGLSEQRLAEWAERQPHVPWINRQARYGLVGGSDDHGSLAVARAYTVYAGARSGAGVAAALRAGTTEPAGESGSGSTLAHNCYGVLAGYLDRSGQGDLSVNSDGPSLLGAMIRARQAPATPGSIAEQLWDHGHRGPHQRLLRDAAEQALARGWRGALGAVFEAVAAGRIGAAADGVPGLLKALAQELPYLLAHRYVARDRRGAERFASELGAFHVGRAHPRVAIFTDTLDDINGVALGLRRLAGEAAREGAELMLVGCGPAKSVVEEAGNVVRLPSIYEHRLAEYPEIAWSVPHLPPLLEFLESREIDLVQCATPGPVGVAAWLAGRLTQTPVIGQYHTDVPEYALRLTGDPAAAAVVRELVGGFYRSLDRVLAPTAWVGGVLGDLGVAADKIVAVPRGIDLARFSPARRNPAALPALGIAGGPVALYVGRLSREKSLDRLLAGFQLVRREVPDATLLLVGDGPLRRELEGAGCPGLVVAGAITGDALATVYASADVFVFPSETETFGNVVIEAQASGLPVVVADRGAAQEHVVEGVTGFLRDPRDHAGTAAAVVRLLRDGEARRRMGAAAAQHARRYDQADALRGTLRLYDRILEELRGPRPGLGRPPAGRQMHDLVA